MINKKVLFLIMGMFLFSLVSVSAFSFNSNSFNSLGTFQQGKNVTLFQSCSNCSYINLTSINFPNGIIISPNVQMQKDQYSYTYNFSDTNQSGDYKYTVCGDKGGSLTCETIGFQITPSGQSNIFSKLIFIGFLVFLSSFFLILFFKTEEEFLSLIFMFLPFIFIILAISSIKTLFLGSSVSFLVNSVYFIVLTTIILLFVYLLIKNISKFNKDAKELKRNKEGLEPIL